MATYPTLSSMLNFSIVVSGSAAVTYLLDTHGHNALHILALSNFGKNMVLYGSTFFANGMILDRGVKVSLMILGACQLVCWSASVPMYIYGKRVRSYVRMIPHLLLAGGLGAHIRVARLLVIQACMVRTRAAHRPG